MSDDRRQAVRDAARYLRQVRPIDPDEIREYVSDQPHPAVVRQLLREEAPNLGLIEREDGCFVPVPDGPLEPTVDASPRTRAHVESVPERHLSVLEDALVERFGPGWHTGDTGDRLRERIREMKAGYLEGSPVEYDDVTALGYALYHLPQSYATATAVLGDLAAEGRLPTHLRVLDVGAGVGGPALALTDLCPDETIVEYTAVEPSAAADLLERFLAETGPNVHHRIEREPIESVDFEALGGPFDLVLCANVLSELDEPSTVAEDLLGHLADDGTLVGIAPADRNTAIDLRTVERHVESTADTTVYAPTVRLWPGETPESECWSIDRRPDLAVPAPQRRLDETGAGDGEFVNVDVQFAYSLLQTDDLTRIDYRGDPSRRARMADMDDHVTERIDCAAVKLSHDLVGRTRGGAGGGPDNGDDGGANPIFLIGDGSERTDHYAVLTEPSVLNEDLESAAYGSLLLFENVLALWNDDEGAYNLVVDGETVVDGPGP